MFGKDDGKRKWQCFVCGHEYGDFETFRAHILEKHEEGREYVVCPLARCGAPVRDVMLHFKAKHPQDSMPMQKGPNRAIVWKDIGKKGGKKSRKPTFRKGHFVSLKNGGKEFEYESSYECEVLECIEVIPEVIAYEAQPFKQGIPYLYKGEAHHYFPDILLKFNDGHVEVWEIKPANQTMLPLNEAKWHAATLYCQTRGWEFIVITEVGIGKLKHRVKNNRE
jgi:hypothetical protein